jgi:lipoprotein NlpD
VKRLLNCSCCLGFGLLLLIILSLISCGRSHPAPVIDAWKQLRASAYRVQRGDTLYSVAFAFGLDYGDIATWNHLHPPYVLKVGDVLIMKKVNNTSLVSRYQSVLSPTKKSKFSVNYRVNNANRVTVSQSRVSQSIEWQWPVKSKVLQEFTGVYGRSQGIDLAGFKGRSVYASASGLVVYSGTGVRGYGKLVIIKHSEEYLSAYAYLSECFVHVGEWVKAGQRIAAMGLDNYGQVRLHFELRQKGKPVNPLRYLHSV